MTYPFIQETDSLVVLSTDVVALVHADVVLDVVLAAAFAAGINAVALLTALLVMLSRSVLSCLMTSVLFLQWLLFSADFDFYAFCRFHL